MRYRSTGSEDYESTSSSLLLFVRFHRNDRAMACRHGPEPEARLESQYCRGRSSQGFVALPVQLHQTTRRSFITELRVPHGHDEAAGEAKKSSNTDPEFLKPPAGKSPKMGHFLLS